MTIDITSFFFNSSIEGATATAAWGTSIGQNQSKSCRIEETKPGVTDMLTGMLYKSISDRTRLDVSSGSSRREVLLFSKFDKVYINQTLLKDQSYVLLLVRENTESHSGRLLISYPPYAIIDGDSVNDMAIKKMSSALGCTENGCWFVYDISVVNQDELHFSAIVVNPDHAMIYKGISRDRSRAWGEMVKEKVEKFDENITNEFNESSTPATQKIYYGCPGTGKSHIVKMISEGEDKDKIIWYNEDHSETENPDGKPKKGLTNNIFRTTFHPDYDYATFVGCYKPCKDSSGKLDYRFIPQVFTNAYVAAQRHQKDPIYLIIEEINRGNCAQIFGDLFQLLDRTGGTSDYEIKPDTELGKYLASQGLPSESLSLPNNLHIYATMNTSDQSLFPMDSAFKRRWAMEYVPIDYEQEKASKFTIEIQGKKYPWIQFLKAVNYLIVQANDSEDKQMGEFFIKDSVSEKEFTNKVMFYLWNDICKDLYNPRRISPQYFLKTKSAEGSTESDHFTFADLYSKKNEDSKLLIGFLEYVESQYNDNHKDDTVEISAQAE